MAGKRILMVLTSHDKLGNTDAQTGWYLPEAAHPHEVFSKAGFNLTYASIKGGVAPLDQGSVAASKDDGTCQKFLKESLKVTKKTIPLAKVKADDYDAIFYVGGFGTMWDFPECKESIELIKNTYEAGKIVAAVCHGPVAFVNVRLSDGSPLLKGKACTAFTNGEEDAVQCRSIVPFTCEDKMGEMGGKFVDGGVFKANVQIEGNLFTGQNPPSAGPLAEAIVEALNTDTTSRSLSLLDSLIGEIARLPDSCGKQVQAVAAPVMSVEEATNMTEDLAKKHANELKNRVPVFKLFKDSDKYVDTNVCVAGWIRTQRIQKTIAFLKIFDGTTAYELQAVVEPSCVGFDQLSLNGMGTAILAQGKIVPSKGKEQAIEMIATSITVLGPCDPVKFPLAGKGHTLDYYRSVGHLRPRTTTLGAITRVRNTLAFGVHNFFQKAGYQYINTPLITASDCEGAGEMFQVTTAIGPDGSFLKPTSKGKYDPTQDFFKKPAFLTVSGQLNAEIYATAMSSVYTFGPTFRAEDSMTYRHLAEFWMIEPEIAFADLMENMDVAEAFLKYTIKLCLEKNDGDLAILEKYEKKKHQENMMEARKLAKKRGKKKTKGPAAKHWKETPLRQRLQNIVDSDFARVTYTKVIETLQKAIANKEVEFEEMNVEWGMDLGSEHERYICEVVHRKPTIVTDYPRGIKAFYMRLNEDKKTVAAMDMLVPGVGELMGGSQREERYDVLCERITDQGMPLEPYEWYLDLRKYGSVPHSGFGCGFERLVCYTTGIHNIRDVIPFPRYPGHADY